MRRLMMTVSVLALYAGASFAQMSDLLITEYLEGGVDNKAIEIFNGTEDIINLNGYALKRYPNGSPIATTIPLISFELHPGSAFVITHTSAEASLLALADQTDTDLNFNGNDALVLVRGGSVIVDSFGQVGEDPGSGWSCSEGSTLNTVMRRLSSICLGDTVVDDHFDPCVEWTFFAQDLYSGLGEHIADCGAVGSKDETWGSLKSLYR